MFTYSYACQTKVAVSAESKLQELLEVFARAPKLESIYVFICKLQPLYFGEAFIVKRGNFAKHIFVKSPPPQKKTNKKLMAKMAFDRC